MPGKAVAHYKEAGRAEALAAFCIGPHRIISAHGATASYVGTSVDVLKDADGEPLGKAIEGAAGGKGEGWVRYRWRNPVSGKVEPRISFVQRVGAYESAE